MILVAAALALAAAGDPPAPATSHDLLILGEGRPISLRLRVAIGGRPAGLAWDESVRALHGRLDRDKDGKLSVAEAVAALPPPPAPIPGQAAAASRPREIDREPKDGVVSVDELAEALKAAAAGPFRVRGEGAGDGRADPLFDQVDRDKDGRLTRPELAAIAGSLRRLDRDDDELIGLDEVASAVVAPAAMAGRAATRPASTPTVVERTADESTTRLARILIRKYDRESPRGPGKLDAKLSPAEFLIPPASFAAADAGGDGLLGLDDLRLYLEKGGPDAILDVAFPADPAAPATVSALGGDGDGGPPSGFKARRLAEGRVELDFDPVLLEVRLDGGSAAIEAVRRSLRAQLKAGDADGDGQVDRAELAGDDGQASPLAGPFARLDGDGDGKVSPREVDEAVAREATAASARLTLDANDEGRSIFGLLDGDGDRRLGAREVIESFARVSACDRDGDAAVVPGEVPHQIRLTLARGDLAGLAPAGPASSARPPTTLGPAWARRMDRNRDGDVSRREFFGTREQFDRVDRDRDGLISPGEAEAAGAVKGPGG